MDINTQKVIGGIIVWLAVVIGIYIMKIEKPTDSVYPVWAVIVGIIFTVVVVVS